MLSRYFNDRFLIAAAKSDEFEDRAFSVSRRRERWVVRSVERWHKTVGAILDLLVAICQGCSGLGFCVTKGVVAVDGRSHILVGQMNVE